MRRMLALGLALVVLGSAALAGAQPARTVRIGWLTSGPHPFITLGVTIPPAMVARADQLIE